MRFPGDNRDSRTFATPPAVSVVLSTYNRSNILPYAISNRCWARRGRLGVPRRRRRLHRRHGRVRRALRRSADPLHRPRAARRRPVGTEQRRVCIRRAAHSSRSSTMTICGFPITSSERSRRSQRRRPTSPSRCSSRSDPDARWRVNMSIPDGVFDPRASIRMRALGRSGASSLRPLRADAPARRMLCTPTRRGTGSGARTRRRARRPRRGSDRARRLGDDAAQYVYRERHGTSSGSCRTCDAQRIRIFRERGLTEALAPSAADAPQDIRHWRPVPRARAARARAARAGAGASIPKSSTAIISFRGAGASCRSAGRHPRVVSPPWLVEIAGRGLRVTWSRSTPIRTRDERSDSPPRPMRSRPQGALPGATRDAQSITRDWNLLREPIAGVDVREVKNVLKDNGYLTEVWRDDWGLRPARRRTGVPGVDRAARHLGVARPRPTRPTACSRTTAISRSCCMMRGRTRRSSGRDQRVSLRNRRDPC